MYVCRVLRESILIANWLKTLNPAYNKIETVFNYKSLSSFKQSMLTKIIANQEKKTI